MRLQLLTIEQFQAVENGGRQIVFHAANQPTNHVLGRLLQIAGSELDREFRVVRVTILERSRQTS